METIRIKGLEIFAYHGVNPEEKENGQKFILDIAMQADISRAAQTDDLNETVNYAAVRKTAPTFAGSCNPSSRRHFPSGLDNSFFSRLTTASTP